MNNRTIFTLILFSALALRLVLSLFASVEYDEGNFNAISYSVFHGGYRLYEHRENKLMMVYALPILVGKFFGGLSSILVLRWINVMLFGLSLLCFYFIVKEFYGDEVALYSGVVYSTLNLFLTSIYHTSSLLMNFEVFTFASVLFAPLATPFLAVLCVLVRPTSLFMVVPLAYLFYRKYGKELTKYFLVSLVLLSMIALFFNVNLAGGIDNLKSRVFDYNLDSTIRYTYDTINGKLFNLSFYLKDNLVLIPGLSCLFMLELPFVLWFACASLVFVWINHVWGHYILELFPVLALSTGFFFSRVLEKYFKSRSIILFMIIFGVTVALAINFYAEVLCIFNTSDLDYFFSVAKNIDNMTSPQDKVFFFANDALIVLSDRSPPLCLSANESTFYVDVEARIGRLKNWRSREYPGFISCLSESKVVFISRYSMLQYFVYPENQGILDMLSSEYDLTTLGTDDYYFVRKEVGT